MSEQQPSPRSLTERLRDALASARASAARRPVPWIAGGLATVLVLGSGGAVAVAAATMPDASHSPSATALTTASSTPSATAASPTPTPTATGRTVPDDAAGPSALRTCTISTAASAGGLGAFEGYVMNAKTGETLFSRNGDKAAQTGSVMKTLTTATALAVLGGDHRIPTTVTRESGARSPWSATATPRSPPAARRCTPARRRSAARPAGEDQAGQHAGDHHRHRRHVLERRRRLGPDVAGDRADDRVPAERDRAHGRR
ncbi:D-alanyl-D-alanine carboxypeptidase [Curtobacterium flaccumfaciens]|nr:D-alanyl-D-alanine carboxypeptidase [Curtobacterium flaccumfaciens]